MRFFYPTILLFFLTLGITKAQSSSTTNSNPFPTISTLTEWASYNSQTKFDIAVRGLLGFKFEEKEGDDASTAYTYIRKVVVNNISYTDRIVYRITNDNSASIISLVTASTDLVSFYSPQLAGYKRLNCSTPMSKEKNTTCSCYENTGFSIDVCDERVKLTMGDGNKYFISVAKK
ncbi:hypothetical protein [Flavobacterium agrisoli]|uniref:Uncharacterized protein n=1 Tax=Flavobacterium agrisoli TaxID=2793066 RepID=A0A934PJ53_9FLAO|nr:hypothetical protein [Flavobacterium agrisoli]MBK0369072.1 hypothetical protein [Flavobacterium agrisoli]